MAGEGRSAGGASGRGALGVASDASPAGAASGGATPAMARRRIRWRRSVSARSSLRRRSISAGTVGVAAVAWGSASVQRRPASDIRVRPAAKAARPGACHRSPATRSASVPGIACRRAASPAMASATWAARSPPASGFPSWRSAIIRHARGDQAAAAGVAAPPARARSGIRRRPRGGAGCQGRLWIASVASLAGGVGGGVVVLRGDRRSMRPGKRAGGRGRPDRPDRTGP